MRATLDKMRSALTTNFEMSSRKMSFDASVGMAFTQLAVVFVDSLATDVCTVRQLMD